MGSRTHPATPRRTALAALALCCALALVPVHGARAAIESGQAIQHDLSPPLRMLKPKAASSHGAHPARRFGNTFDELRLAPRDRARQAVDAPAAAPVPGSQWEGIGNRNGVVPPDANGDVGPRDYVQWVNLSLQIWSKDGTSRYGPVDGNTLWQGFGGVCQSSNEGDPVVTYDRQADRWVLMQFAFNVQGQNTAPPYFLCVAVSQGGDPTGAYYRYGFQVAGSNFADYPKLGVWNDAYYVTTNNFGSNDAFLGAGVYALDRTAMLAGRSATFVGTQLDSRYGGLLPANAVGATPPPAGAPGYFMASDENGTAPDSTLWLWRMHPDFATPQNTAIEGPTPISVDKFSQTFCGSPESTACVQQPGTQQKLDPLSDRLMNRLQYRNFGDHESLVASQTVDVGSNQAGERWYELRAPGAIGDPTPAVEQQGTYAPADGVSRWMGSAAMDGYGDLALGYSASSSSVFPSIRYTGRLGSDGQPGVMTQGEHTIAAGAGSQTGYARWGDYSSMSVDPVDDATFWYTSEYYTSSSAAGWHTRIGSFKLAATPAVTIAAPADGSTAGALPSFSGGASTAGGDASSVSVKVYAGSSTSGTLVQTLTAARAGDGSWSVPASSALAQGTYTAQAQQAGAGGYVGYSELTTFTVAAPGPVPSITSPSSGAVTNDATPTISGSAGIAAGDLAGVTVVIHTGAHTSDPVAQTLSATRSPSGAWSVTPATALAEGTHAIEANQSDSAGDVGTSAPVAVSIDVTAPAVALTSPAQGALSAVGTPTFAGTAGGAAGDSRTVTVKVYPGGTASGTPLETRTASVGAGGAFSVGASPALAPGAYSARAEQSDSAGNVGSSAPVAFTVAAAGAGNVAPTAAFSFAPLAPVAGAGVAFDGTASRDPDGTIASFAWSFGDGWAASGATATHAYAAPGSYSAQLTVTDDAGAGATVAEPVVVGAALRAGRAPQPAARLALRIARQRLRSVLRRGLALTLTSSRAGTATVRLALPTARARRLGLRGTTLARAAVALRAGRPATLRLRLGSRARRVLSGRRALSATVRVALGSTQLRQPLTLRR